MDLTIKSLELSGGNYLIVITRGHADARELEQVFLKVALRSQSLVDCKVLIDLADVRLSLEPADIHELVDDLRPDLLRPDIKIAVVSSTETREFDQLRVLSTALSSRGFQSRSVRRHKSRRSLAQREKLTLDIVMVREHFRRRIEGLCAR